MDKIINNKIILVFIDEDWNHKPLGYTRRNLITAMAEKLIEQDAVVVCIQRPVDLFVTPFKQPAKFVSYFKNISKIKPLGKNLFIFTPIMLSHERLALYNSVFRFANRYLLKMQIKKTLFQLQKGRSKVITWIFHPYQRDMIGILDEDLSIYECYDEYGALIPPPEKERINNLEKDIINKVDIILTTAKKLFDKIIVQKPDTFLVQNGVDFDLFSGSNNETAPEPEDLKDIPHPRIGYAGAINDLLDFGLVNKIATQRPEWSFVFIGPNNGSPAFKISRGLAEAESIKNIHFPGNKPYSVVPQYLKYFDVCIMPYLVNECTVALYPLKLNEYLAAGRPVVCTDFVEDLKEFNEVVWITNDIVEFELALTKSIQAAPERINRGIEIARSNSWKARASTIISIIDKKLK